MSEGSTAGRSLRYLPALLACTILWLAGAPSPAAGQMSPERFGQDLERAKELNVTEPWQVSQALLDQLEPHLAEATREQAVEYWLLAARNQALAGDMGKGLATLQELLGGPMRVDQRVRAYSRAANLALLLRKWEETFEYLIRGLELKDRLEPADRVHVPFGLAAYLYAKVGEIDSAIEYGRLAVATAQAHGNAWELCIVQGRLAFVYKTSGQQAQALRHYRDALDACLKSGDELITGTVESGLADLLREAGDHAEAEELFTSALARLTATDYTYGLAETRLYSARLELERGRKDRLRELLEVALPELEQQQAWEYVAEAHEMLARAAATSGDHREAFEHMQSGLEARQRFLDRDRSLRLAHLQIAFDTRSQQQELALLREQQRAAELAAQSRRAGRHMRWLGAGAAGLLLLVLFLLLAHVARGRRHFRRLSELDGLTGLANHTRFFDAARALADRCASEGRSFALVLGDIDHFKRVNDEHGHMAGDRTLRQVARVLRECSPEGAPLGRIGGEEFAVCLPAASRASAGRFVEDVRAALGKVGNGGTDAAALTMSFGVAEANPGESLGALRLRADQALYRAKHAGRDEVVFADPD